MNPISSFSPPARGLVVAGAVALVITLLKVAAPLVAPILLAIFIAIIATPALDWMRRHGAPKLLALAVITFILIDLGSLFALMTTGALEGFKDSLPSYQERFMLLNQELGQALERFGLENSTEAVPDLMDPALLTGLVRYLLSNASGAFATGFLVLLTVVFILLEVPSMPAKLRAAFNLSEAGEARIFQLLANTNRYMLIKTVASLGTGFCVWLMLWFFGIKFASLLAVIAFLMNFLPVVGNILMMIPGVLLALVQVDLGTALLVAAGYLIINLIIGNIIEPRVMGKGLGISTLAVFIALLFWGWLFGTIGMFLAVPLTAALIIALDASPHTRPLAILMGPGIEEEPEPADEAPPDSGNADAS